MTALIKKKRHLLTRAERQAKVDNMEFKLRRMLRRQRPKKK